MRTVFHEQLDDLTAAIAEICGLAGQAMQDATQALLQANLALAEGVIGEHDNIMLRAAHAEQHALTLLALQAPVAGDLRAVVASLKNIADAERMGALALHVAKIVRRRHPAHALPEEVNAYFDDMGRIAVDLGNNAKEVVQSVDPRKAAQLRHDDDAMDDLHRQLFTLLIDRQWKHGVAAAVDVTLLGRYYERFADHAVEIGRRVIFQATGTTKPRFDPGPAPQQARRHTTQANHSPTLGLDVDSPSFDISPTCFVAPRIRPIRFRLGRSRETGSDHSRFFWIRDTKTCGASVVTKVSPLGRTAVTRLRPSFVVDQFTGRSVGLLGTATKMRKSVRHLGENSGNTGGWGHRHPPRSLGTYRRRACRFSNVLTLLSF